MTPGGTLGEYCSHAYAHATKEGANALPSILRGSDMVAYEVFRYLGMSTHVLPVLDAEEGYTYEPEGLGDDQKAYRNHGLVRKNLSGPVKTNEGGFDGDTMDEINTAFPHESLEVMWLDDRKFGTENMQLGHLRVSIARSALFVL
jgi:hypothetical protein